MGTSKIFVDLKQRTFSLEVPDEKIEEILDKVETLFLKIAGDQGGDEAAPEFAVNRDLQSTPAESERVAEAPVTKRRAKSGGKVKSWSLVELGLSEGQRQEMREFFSEKSPIKQNEIVAVLSVKLKDLTGKSVFSGDEVHSALKVVSQPTPKNLSAVFGNMKRDGWGDYKGTDFVVTSYTEDKVKFELPPKAKK